MAECVSFTEPNERNTQEVYQDMQKGIHYTIFRRDFISIGKSLNLNKLNMINYMKESLGIACF